MAYTSTLLTARRIGAMREAAHAAYAASPERAIYTPVLTVDTLAPAQHAGLDDRNQPQSRRRRNAMAARTTRALLGLPEDAVWFPCYVGGCAEDGEIVLWDGWTMDGDHVNPDGGSHPHNLMLACAFCNTLVKGARPIHPNAESAIVAAGAGLGYVKGGKGLLSWWGARERRTAGGNFEGRRYGG